MTGIGIIAGSAIPEVPDIIPDRGTPELSVLLKAYIQGQTTLLWRSLEAGFRRVVNLNQIGLGNGIGPVTTADYKGNIINTSIDIGVEVLPLPKSHW